MTYAYKNEMHLERWDRSNADVQSPYLQHICSTQNPRLSHSVSPRCASDFCPTPCIAENGPSHQPSKCLLLGNMARVWIDTSSKHLQSDPRDREIWPFVRRSLFDGSKHPASLKMQTLSVTEWSQSQSQKDWYNAAYNTGEQHWTAIKYLRCNKKLMKLAYSLTQS